VRCYDVERLCYDVERLYSQNVMQRCTDCYIDHCLSIYLVILLPSLMIDQELQKQHFWVHKQSYVYGLAMCATATVCSWAVA
jgi:hypothetical protein